MIRDRGFSLIEMIVAMAILSVFVLIIVGLERGALDLVKEADPARPRDRDP